ncbi:MAG: undecaprenyldiphospho-muramoylpentapeptide beta-N-acetylglucosaminyltransferase [Ignavibacteriales bacterium]|nr:undecaprenyldiphospho-muramoylpentapeptide beta-N-acetylglucosaminyltransferase [Ignavibacteriales bacterium]
MSLQANKYRFLFAGGGTGGHIFPAIAVAENIRLLVPNSEIIFVGTRSKIEAHAVPNAGFAFKSIWIKGFSRKLSLQNFIFPLKVLVSCVQSLLINMKFKPQVAIGSGGYVSGPAIWAASILGAKIILLEQNSYPGITTRLLEKKASEIHICFEDTKKYLRGKEKLFVTGNPVRASLKLIDKEIALKKFNFSSKQKTILILGGSLGAASINIAIASGIDRLKLENIQVIWQTGKLYFDRFKNLANDSILIIPFIDDMSAAFSTCDLLISRAGATTIAEITNLGIASILVPSPNVAANHQYFNAKSLADKRAAILVKDRETNDSLFDAIINLVFNEEELNTLKENVKKFSKPEAASVIAKRAIKLAEAL